MKGSSYVFLKKKQHIFQVDEKDGLLTVSSFLGTVLSDQSLEVYNKDDSDFLGNSAPRFRDSATLSRDPSSEEPYYVSLNGPNQHGFKLVNPKYESQQTHQQNSLRKQQQLLYSTLESLRDKVPQSITEVYGSSKRNQAVVEDSRLKTTNLYESGNLEQGRTHEIAREPPPHKSFHFRLNGQEQNVPSQSELLHHSRGFTTSPKPIQLENNFNNFRSNPVDYSSEQLQPEFREKSATPAFQTDFGGVGHSTGERTPFSRIIPNQSRKVNVQQQDNSKGQFGFQTPPRTLNVNSATFSPILNPEEPALLSQTVSGEEKFGERSNIGLASSPVPITPRPLKFNFKGQAGDEEETKFISQLNENTAAFVSKKAEPSQLTGFQQELPRRGHVQTIQPSKILSQDFPVTTTTPEIKLDTKISRQRSRIVPANVGVQQSSTLSPISSSHFDTAQRNQGTVAGKNTDLTVDQELEARKQAENAHYSFSSGISDTVNDNTQYRQEVRDGLKLAGMYSYSDGFFKRTVYYEADEGGYRIIREESEPIGTGPQYNPNGEINVNFEQAGSNLQYKIRGDQLKRPTNEGRRKVPSTRPDDYSDQLQLPA